MDSLNIDQHISSQFNQELEHMRSDILALGGIVEQQIADASNAIENVDPRLAEKVLRIEKDVDTREILLDKNCTGIIAKRQPAATDLRLILASIKITRDLERMGDEAAKIANMAIALSTEITPDSGYVMLHHIAGNVRVILRSALDAFARYDVEVALQVMQDDQEIDKEYGELLQNMIASMEENPNSITRTMHVIWALRSFERLGDHARNIAEHVIYLVKGQDVRHEALADVMNVISEAS